MGTRPQSRLAIAVILLSFQALLGVSQYLLSIQYHRNQRFLLGPAFLQSLGFPIFVAVLGIVLIAVMFNGEDPKRCDLEEYMAKANKTCIDDDIGGLGIRLAAWAQLGVLLFLALIGTFHTKTTGIKEVTASLTITHLSLVIALLVNLKGLEATDAILGSMILDSKNSALSIPLVTKTTLAARWQVWTIVPCQVFGLAVIGFLVHRFHQNQFNVCCQSKCVSVVWWGRLRTKEDGTSGWEQAAFWIYYACRVLSVAQSAYQALVDTYAFHEAENSDDTLASKTFHPLSNGDSRLTRFFRKLLRIHGQTWKFVDCPTTLSLTFLVSGVFAVASMAAAEAALRKGSLGTESNEFTTGQIIAMVVAVTGIIVGVWRFVRLFPRSGQTGRRYEGSWRCWPLPR
ncbi:unnamed protein product [Colletotrichum noveboracense]|uniref:Uncharacterized protein n=1 Tax=Colletotrichum noveboracense TaxID=2664923 RepID=A0A9W4RV10_9PEZI|nr:unnamed protein product [Colletotrichum noveboracense]